MFATLRNQSRSNYNQTLAISSALDNKVVDGED